MASSPSRNRVTPLGDVVAAPFRGAWTGNRGCLHAGREIVRFHASDLWIVCALRFRDRHHAQWLPRRFTWLYFYDEAVAFAAGHRPCGECRHDAYVRFKEAVGATSAQELNRTLHRERLVRGTHRRRFHRVPWAELPDGTFVLRDGVPAVVVGDQLVDWTTAGYGRRHGRPAGGEAEVVTPPSAVAALRAGYPVQIDQAAQGGRVG